MMMKIEQMIGIAKNEIVNRGYDIDRLCKCYGHGTVKYMLKYLNVAGRSKLNTKKQMWEVLYPMLKSNFANDNETYKGLAAYWSRLRQ